MTALIKLVKNNPHRARIDGVELELITESLIPYNGKNRPLLVVHPTKNFLDKLYAMKNISQMMVVPWVNDEIKEWTEYSNAKEYGVTNTKKMNIAANSIILNALEDMTYIMNLANGLIHPRNVDIVIETFEILHRNGEKLDKEEVKTYLIKYLKWDPILAEEASDLVRKVKEGKRHKFITGMHWHENIITEWRKRSSTFA
jgi:hypothetical protein